MDKKIAIVLGGTVPHIELINQLKDRGYYTILIDYLVDSPAKSVADEHIRESTLDQEIVLKIAKERNANLIICGCIDQANITACYAMEGIGLKPPYSYETAKNITNKGYMKRVMEENNIPTSKFVYINDASEIPEINIDFPVMVKPADSNSANGVKKAENYEKMQEYLQDALKISRNGRAIVEEFVEGQEISAYCYVQDKKAKLLMTAERLSVIEGEDKVIKCYASIAPAMISKKAEKNAEDIVTRIAKAFDLDNTPLFFQGIVKGDNIYVIEFAPRVGGGISFKTIKDNTGYDIITATIESYLGNKPNLEYHNPNNIMVVNTFYGKDGVYDYVSGQDDLLADNVIEHIFYHKKPGAIIDNSRASSSRVGAFIVKASNEDEMFKKVEEAYKRLDVFNEQGESMIRRELNITNIIRDKNIIK